MPTSRKKLRTDKIRPGASDLTSAPPRAFASSFLFFFMLAVLCAGGYFYYDYQQQRTRQAKEIRAARAEKANRLRVENERKKKELIAAKKNADTEREKQASRHMDMQIASSQTAHAESDAELAAREAKERASILAAEERQRLQEIEDRADFLNPYRHEQQADDDSLNQSPPAANAVVAALEQYEVFNAKPNAKSDFYIYLCSAGWCSNCAKIMPIVREAGKQMKRAGKVELILISFDKSLADARSYAKGSQLKSPTVWIEAMRQKVFQQLPGFNDDGFGIPHLFIVDKNGQLVTRGHGSLIKDWRAFTLEHHKQDH
ncbi:MAG: redoxin domain-containing protein [Akkermansia sp.]|nr:redoxin domain-containing protein [Akkermansia sp.]